jgi:hypothetical protein
MIYATRPWSQLPYQCTVEQCCPSRAPLVHANATAIQSTADLGPHDHPRPNATTPTTHTATATICGAPCPAPSSHPRKSLPTPGPPTHKSVRSQLASVGACRNITYPMHALPYQVPDIERGIAGRHRAATCRAARTLRRSAAQPVLPCVHGCEAAVACMYQEAACHAGHETTQEHHTCQAAACIGQ